jgi:hypothetical protein
MYDREVGGLGYRYNRTIYEISLLGKKVWR